MKSTAFRWARGRDRFIVAETSLFVRLRGGLSFLLGKSLTGPFRKTAGAANPRHDLPAVQQRDGRAGHSAPSPRVDREPARLFVTCARRGVLPVARRRVASV